MSKYILILFVVFGTSIVFAQGDILTDSVKVEGVYLTFDDFRKNSPSFPGKVRIMKYQIRIFDEADHEFMSIKEAYWGACLNDTVYIYQDLENASSKPRIYPIQFIDRYSFFSGYSSKTSGAIENGPGSYNHGDLGDSPFVLNTTTKEGEFIININNGIIYELSDKLIKAILKDDPELSNLYENDKDKKENFKKYILEYNRRHPDKIKPMNH